MPSFYPENNTPVVTDNELKVSQKILGAILDNCGGGAITIQDEGTAVTASASTINFVGAGVVATDAGGGVTQVSINGGAVATPTGTGFTHNTTGVQDVASKLVENADVAAAAAIAFSKLANVSATDRVLGRQSAGAGPIEEITFTSAARALSDDATASDQRTTLGLANANKRTIQFSVSSGNPTVAIATGLIAADVRFPWAGTITKWTVFGIPTTGNATCSVVFDIWKDTFANHPPTVLDTITASAKPTLTAATAAEGSSLGTWTPSIAAGETLRSNIDSQTNCMAATVILEVTLS